ncbi:DNA starvation/stationary phase protection protein [Brevibacillus reuszeri]|uniref:DNA starvation/stationary phase protection protein n=1 Tax=Brevibacillus reuszeri TaxID=54915 RepID=A0A0K9YX67_9BACL|nr:Dps family protein [Brevibacillus reuszeri]KNB73278.1 general stress protein [Brevibacillus reuszeri]MED1856891.1 DNA starvation/stationary phase protection protein [Brevibacillus reuszeri]GED68359.1 DNA starvation/stationary phase protection protein [Brevibacillus reuszeri]
MSITISRPVTEVLNKQVASWSVLYIKLHHFHWYVSGPNFFTLHAKFEELYNEAAKYVDELAERLLAVGGKPVSTMKACMEKSSVQEAAGGESAEQMVQVVVSDFTKLIAELKEGIVAAEEADDDATGDMFLGMSESLQKHVWMLQAFLGK